MSGMSLAGLGSQAAGSIPPVVPSHGVTVDGQPYRVCATDEICDAPPVRAWGSEPIGSDYRTTWDAVGARLGTQNPIKIITEIERQLSADGARVAPPPARPAAATAPPEPSQEGFGSFVEGLVKGDFSSNDSWSKTGGQIVGGLIPFYGLGADIRDIGAAIGDVWNGKPGSLINLGAAGVGILPLVGDGAKALIRGGSKLADASGEIAEAAAKRDLPGGSINGPNAAAAERGVGRMFSPGELMGVEQASTELLASVGRKRSVVIAQPGSDELKMLDYFGAEASVNTAENGILNGSIVLRQNPSKAAVMEEFLHGTQARLGVIDRLGSSGLGSAETHVKDFMIRHQRMIGLSNEDVTILKILRDKGY